MRMKAFKLLKILSNPFNFIKKEKLGTFFSDCFHFENKQTNKRMKKKKVI